MTKGKRTIDNISMQEAEIIDSQYAIFVAQAEQISSWIATREYLSKHEASINRLLSALKNNYLLEDSDKNDIAGAFFALWYFGHICFDERYTDDCLNECLCFLSPSTCITYSELVGSLDKTSGAIAELIENGDILEAARLKKPPANIVMEQGENDLF
jgi:hypothetical protein